MPLHRRSSFRAVYRFPNGSYIARIGGDEFAVLLPGSPIVLQTAERIRVAVGELAVARGFDVTVSIGAATLAGKSGMELLRQADEALYRVKAAGRNAVQAYMKLKNESSTA